MVSVSRGSDLGSVSDMKRAAPSEEAQDVSSGDSSSSDSVQKAEIGKGGSASKAAAAAEGESYLLLAQDKLIAYASFDGGLADAIMRIASPPLLL